MERVLEKIQSGYNKQVSLTFIYISAKTEPNCVKNEYR